MVHCIQPIFWDCVLLSSKMLFLENLTEPNLFMTPLYRVDDQQEATYSWNKLNNAMTVLGFSADEVNGICSTLAAIYHLGIAGVMRGGYPQFCFHQTQIKDLCL